MKVALICLGTRYDLVPPLGIVSIYSYITKNSEGIDIKIIDLNFDNLDESVKSYGPDVIGISSMSPFYGEAVKLANKIRQISKAPIILGGTHITILPNALNSCFDIGVLGEGEQTMLELLQAYQKSGRFEPDSLRAIKGLMFWDNGRLVQTNRRELIKNLDEIPLIDWSRINESYFKKLILRSVNLFAVPGYLLTSRGCPFKCVFCSSSIFWQCSIRYHSAKRVVDEIEHQLKTYGSTHFQIVDDLFAADKERLIEIISLLKERGLLNKISFECQTRVNLADEERIRLLKEMNTKRVFFGFESGSEKYLKYLKRDTTTVEQGKKAALLCEKYRLTIGGTFIFGGPGETLEDMEQTLSFMDFLLKHKVGQIATFILIPLPGTEIWEIAKKRGKVSDDMDWGKIVETQDSGNALLLDSSIDIEKFKAVYREARMRVAATRKQGLFDILKNSPVDSIKFILLRPAFVVSALKNIFLGEHQKPKEFMKANA